ncbi:hypothetical protein GCM10010524_66670 [Streptomyces mexicanus]
MVLALPAAPVDLGAEATTPVRAYEFDAAAVRTLCEQDPEFGRAVAVWVGRAVAHRLHTARVRLLDLYARTAAAAPDAPGFTASGEPEPGLHTVHCPNLTSDRSDSQGGDHARQPAHRQ